MSICLRLIPLLLLSSLLSCTPAPSASRPATLPAAPQPATFSATAFTPAVAVFEPTGVTILVPPLNWRPAAPTDPLIATINHRPISRAKYDAALLSAAGPQMLALIVADQRLTVALKAYHVTIPADALRQSRTALLKQLYPDHTPDPATPAALAAALAPLGLTPYEFDLRARRDAALPLLAKATTRPATVLTGSLNGIRNNSRSFSLAPGQLVLHDPALHAALEKFLNRPFFTIPADTAAPGFPEPPLLADPDYGLASCRLTLKSDPASPILATLDGQPLRRDDFWTLLKTHAGPLFFDHLADVVLAESALEDAKLTLTETDFATPPLPEFPTGVELFAPLLTATPDDWSARTHAALRKLAFASAEVRITAQDVRAAYAAHFAPGMTIREFIVPDMLTGAKIRQALERDHLSLGQLLLKFPVPSLRHTCTPEQLAAMRADQAVPRDDSVRERFLHREILKYPEGHATPIIPVGHPDGSTTLHVLYVERLILPDARPSFESVSSQCEALAQESALAAWSAQTLATWRTTRIQRP